MKLPNPSLRDLVQIYGEELVADINPAPWEAEENAHPVGYEYVPGLGPSQMEAYLAKERNILMYGERFSGKTHTLNHRLVRHCWRHFDAHALLVVGVQSQGKVGGAWHDLQDLILPDWKENQPGFDYSIAFEDSMKLQMVWIRNRYRGSCLLQLMSFPHGAKLKSRVRGISVSAMGVEEIVGIGGDEYFKLLSQQVGRRRNIPKSEQWYAATCNPDGPSHWVHKTFFQLPEQKPEFRHLFRTIHLPFTENPTPDAQEYKEHVMVATEGDPVEQDRLLHGKWVDRVPGEALFGRYFVPEIHVRGDWAKSTTLIPKRGMQCANGYDVGDVNHAVVLGQPITLNNGKRIWSIFDEVVYVGKEIPHEDLTEEVMEAMNEWGVVTDSRLPFKHISDRSAFDRFRGGTGSRDYRLIQNHSKKLYEESPDRFGALLEPIKRIVPCPKLAGSVKDRIKLLRRLLRDEEIYVGAKCKHVIDMLTYIVSEKDDVWEPKRDSSGRIHVFDALTYMLLYYDLGKAEQPEHDFKFTQAGS